MGETSDEPTRCVHFRGIQNTCGAGINPMTLRDSSKRGMAVWPCLHLVGYRHAETTCSSLRVMTREEVDAENAKMTAAVDKFVADLAAGNCPHCSVKIERRERHGRCEYAKPCGHRLGQVGDEFDEPPLPSPGGPVDQGGRG